MALLRRILAPLAMATVTVLVASGCTAAAIKDPLQPDGPEPTEEPAAADSITITWLAFTGNGQGTTGTTAISRKEPSTPGDFRVEFSANEVGGIGGASQAGAWNAAIISTLLLSQPLEGEFRFETDGFIDGPSAGALTTAGLLALANGEEFLDNVTMTGTINSTGTIGPVGGIPEKLQAAGDEGFTKVLIPLGQRNSVNFEGQMVDLVREGDRIGVEVIEVGDIYEAYEHLTGTNIDVPGVTRDARLSDDAYDKVKPQVDSALANYGDAEARYMRLPAEVQNVFVQTGMVQAVQQYITRAQDLQRQGLQAGAFQAASQGAMLLDAIVSMGEMLNPIFTQGLAGLEIIFNQALDTSVTEREFFAFLDKLSAYSPKSISDVEGLVNGFAGAFDAYSLLMLAQGSVQSIQSKWNNGQYESIDALFAELTQPVLWSQLASAQITYASNTFEVGRDNPGAAISDDIDLAQLGDFFRRGADANYAAFEANIVNSLADANGMSPDAVTNALANADLNVAMAVSQANIQPAIADYIGGQKANSQYATLGYGLNNYVRNQGLLDKYYNNATLDGAFNITGVQYDAVLARTLDLGRQQLSAEIDLLTANATEPVLAMAGYEVASLMRSGSVVEQFDAAATYQRSFLTARTMAYIAGLSGQGK